MGGTGRANTSEMNDELSTDAPTEAIGFRIVVTPHSIYQSCWEFVLLLDPNDHEIAQPLAQDVCNQILDDGDEYLITKLDELEDGVVLPVLSYKTNSENFEWLMAPRHLLN